MASRRAAAWWMLDKRRGFDFYTNLQFDSEIDEMHTWLTEQVEGPLPTFDFWKCVWRPVLQFQAIRQA